MLAPFAPRLRRHIALGAFAALMLGLSACGDNTFNDGVVDPDPTDQPPAAVLSDTTPPSDAKIVLPLPDATLAVGDPLNVRVFAADAVALDSVVVLGITRAGAVRFEPASKQYQPADSMRADTATLVLTAQGSEPADTVLLIATVYDRAGNVAADTTAISLAVIRGELIALENTVDRIVDLVSDGRRVFLSNFSRNRVEVLDIASNARSTFRVGSEPWGLALSPDSSTLLVANSGGTNVSRVDLTAAVLREDEARRIYTPNVRLYQVPFSRDSVETAEGKKSVLVPASVIESDYSDRPQFIAQTRGGRILYSTKPTGTAADGTLRVRRTDGEVEFFLDYARRDQSSSLVIVNARDAGLVEGDPNQLAVLTKEGNSLVGFVDEVEAQLESLGSETRFEYFLNLEDIGLQDTTFVAVSGDHRTVGFGEGAANPGRIIVYREDASGTTLVRSGDTDDLVNNAAERVIGLALNRDGSLGAARGDDAYFFTPDLRLQGVGLTGAPTGGIALRPGHRDYPNTPPEARLAFVSGRDGNGSPYIDVLDTFSFFRQQRIFLRRAVTGPLVAVPAPAGSGAEVRIYAVTDAGILRLDLSGADLRP